MAAMGRSQGARGFGALMALGMTFLSTGAASAAVLMKPLAPHPGVGYAALLVRDHLLVSEAGYSRIQVIPVRAPEQRFEVPTGRSPFQFLPMGDEVLVSNALDEQMTVLGPDFQIRRQIPVPLGLTGILLREGELVGVLPTDNALLRMPLPSFDPPETLDAGSGPWRLAGTPTHVAVINHRSLVDPEDDALLLYRSDMRLGATVETPGGLRDVTSRDDGLFYATLRARGEVIVVDPFAATIVQRFPAGSDTASVAHLENLVLAVSASDHRLTAIDLEDGGVSVTADLNQFGSPLESPLTVVAGPDGVIYFVAQGTVARLDGFLERKESGHGWRVSHEVHADRTIARTPDLGGTTPARDSRRRLIEEARAAGAAPLGRALLGDL